jgi:lysophospholipase L1-like esterase
MKSTKAAALVPPTPLRPHPDRRGSWLGGVAKLLAGLAIGLAVAEAAFWYRDGGAFPHLNLYVADAELGVRLAPGATEKIAFGGNPITSVRINGDGYRGGELPAPEVDDVLVVGDSQVFGLGVEEHETFSAVLGKTIGAHVINAGVPTYGPAEYRQVIVEQLAKRHPRTVVLTINLVNDLFEVRRPNKDRHAVWDGWAVRKETAPASIIEVPGRELLYRRSHLVFAVRKWWHALHHAEDQSEQHAIDERGVASEGTWRDIATLGVQVQQQRAGLDAARRKRLDDVSWVHKQIEDQERAIDRKIIEVLHDSEGADSFSIAVARANPGDILAEATGETARLVGTTVTEIAAAAAVRARLRVKLTEWAKSRQTGDAAQTLATLDAREQALAKLSELDVQKLAAALELPLGTYIRDVHQLVHGAGARLVVLILPIDVQVSADEWKKYAAGDQAARGIDMEPSKALTAELVELSRALGVSVLDATPVLAQAEPGAFLDKDIHMTPKGHASVAAALARTLAESPPAPVVTERSPIPMPEVFKQAQGVTVRGASEAACETKQVREWLRVLCSRTYNARPLAIDIERDDGHEALAMVMPRHVSLVIPIVAGRELAAKISWTDRTRVLRVRWPDGAASPSLTFDPPLDAPAPAATEPLGPQDPFRSPVERAICECWDDIFGAGNKRSRSRLSCSDAYGATDAACVARYYQPTKRCPELLACTRRDPASPP